LLCPSGPLELGGKGCMVVCKDAALGDAVDWALAGIFICAGQVCFKIHKNWSRGGRQ